MTRNLEIARLKAALSYLEIAEKSLQDLLATTPFSNKTTIETKATEHAAIKLVETQEYIKDAISALNGKNVNCELSINPSAVCVTPCEVAINCVLGRHSHKTGPQFAKGPPE